MAGWLCPDPSVLNNFIDTHLLDPRSVVSIATSGVDYLSAPKDYAELFRIYYVYVVRLVHKHGIDENQKEDVASEILTRFYERGFLEKFDPTLTFVYKGQQRPARFRSFLSKFVLTYVRGHYDKQKRVANREWQVCDLLLTGDSSDAGVRWVDIYGESEPSHEDNVLDGVMESDFVRGLRNYLADLPPRSDYDRCDLVELFDTMVDQVRDRGEYNVYELAARFGVSYTAMHQWVWRLRAHLADATGRPLPPKRPRAARPKPVES